MSIPIALNSCHFSVERVIHPLPAETQLSPANNSRLPRAKLEQSSVHLMNFQASNCIKQGVTLTPSPCLNSWSIAIPSRNTGLTLLLLQELCQALISSQWFITEELKVRTANCFHGAAAHIQNKIIYFHCSNLDLCSALPNLSFLQMLLVSIPSSREDMYLPPQQNDEICR